MYYLLHWQVLHEVYIYSALRTETKRANPKHLLTEFL